MKLDMPVQPPATTFPLPSLPSLSDVTQRFWDQLLGGLLNPEAGGDISVQSDVGGKPWR